MAKTTIASVGGIVCVDGRGGEEIITVQADGAMKSGNLVGITNATNRILGTDVNASVDQFVGIVLPSFDLDSDAVPDAGDPIEIVKPKAGRKYNIRVDDLGANLDLGGGIKFGDNPGIAAAHGTIEGAGKIASVSFYYTDDDTVVEVTWGSS